MGLNFIYHMAALFLKENSKISKKFCKFHRIGDHMKLCKCHKHLSLRVFPRTLEGACPSEGLETYFHSKFSPAPKYCSQSLSTVPNIACLEGHTRSTFIYPSKLKSLRENQNNEAWRQSGLFSRASSHGWVADSQKALL